MRLLMPFSHPVPLLLVVLLLAAIHGTFAAPLGEYFSPADADAYVEAALRTLGDSEADVTSKDYAVRLLKALDHASAATGYKSSACAAVSSVLASGDLAGIHHGLSLRDGVGCTGGIPLEARGAIEAAIQVWLRACTVLRVWFGLNEEVVLGVQSRFVCWRLQTSLLSASASKMFLAMCGSTWWRSEHSRTYLLVCCS